MTEYQAPKKPRRFIAGTVCPKCSKMDTTQMYQSDSGDDVRECVACGFVQTFAQQEIEDSAKAAELATRVSDLDEKAVWDEGEKPLRIIGLDDTDH